MNIIIPFMTGFVFILYLVFGPEGKDFHTFGRCIYMVLFFIVGQQQTEELY